MADRRQALAWRPWRCFADMMSAADRTSAFFRSRRGTDWPAPNRPPSHNSQFACATRHRVQDWNTLPPFRKQHPDPSTGWQPDFYFMGSQLLLSDDCVAPLDTERRGRRKRRSAMAQAMLPVDKSAHLEIAALQVNRRYRQANVTGNAGAGSSETALKRTTARPPRKFISYRRF